MPPVRPRTGNDSDDPDAVPGRTRTTASEVVDGGRPCGSRMAAEIPLESGAKHDRHQSQRRAAVSESPHANVLVLRQRTAQAGPLLRSFATATVAIHS